MPDDASKAIRRYSRHPLPKQRYLPGQRSRPIARGSEPGPFDAARWWTCEDFLFGVDLWNCGFFWEAHEAWEVPWRAAGRDTEVGRLLQGLILVAAAAVKHELGMHEAARRLAVRGARMLRESGAEQALDLAAFAASVGAWAGGETSTPPLLKLDAARPHAHGD